jgi:iron complex outermembrane receptor protein
VRGGEVELVAPPAEGLYLSVGLSALDTEIDEVRDLNSGALLTGTQMVLAPEFSANGLVRYTWNLSGSLFSLQADFSHQDDHFFDVVNQPIAREDAYTVWNARAAYAFGSALNWEVSAWVKNLTDEEYRLYTFDFSGPGAFNQQFLAPPRWYGVTLNYQL